MPEHLWIPKTTHLIDNISDGWTRIQLVGLSDDPDDGWYGLERMMEVAPRSVASLTPSCIEAVRRLEGRTLWATLSRLAPRSMIRRHNDGKRWDRWRLWHIPIVTNPGAFLVTWFPDGPVLSGTRPGYPVELPWQYDHMAVNGGEEHRVHLYVMKTMRWEGDCL